MQIYLPVCMITLLNQGIFSSKKKGGNTWLINTESDIMIRLLNYN